MAQALIKTKFPQSLGDGGFLFARKPIFPYDSAMSTQAKLASNTLYLTLASIAQKVIAFVYFTIIARFAGVSDTGSYFLALAVVSVMSALGDVGLTSVLIREVSRNHDKAKEWVKNVIGWKMIAIPVAVIASFIVPEVLNYRQELTLLIRVASLVMVADMISVSLYGALRGLQSLKYEAIGIFIGQTLSATIGTVLIFTGHATLALLIVALLVGSIWNACFSAWHIIRKLGAKALIPSYSFGLTPIKLSFAFFLAAVFVKLYSYIDSITLSAVLGEEAVGIYAVAYKLTYAFQFLPLAFVAALYPTMSRFSKDTETLKNVLLDAFWYLGLIGFPIVFGIWSLSPEIIHAFYGTAFEPSIIALQVLIFVLLPIFLDFPIGSFLNATNRQATKTALMGITMMINLIANITLIPRFGVLGASIASLISFTFLFVSGWVIVRRILQLSEWQLVKRIGGLLLSAIVMAVIVVITKEFMHFTLAIILGAIVYGACTLFTGSLTVDHLLGLKRLIWKKAYVENTTPDA